MKVAKSSTLYCLTGTSHVFITLGVGGYVLHNLHNKHRTKTSSESQQAVSILKAGKSKTNDHSQNLILSVTQGGLWFISHPAQKIFFQTEYFLRESLKLVYKKLIFLVLFLSQSVAVL